MTDAWRATFLLGAAYLAFGICLPSLPLWLESARGLSGEQIGWTVFGASLGRVITGPISGAWAEQFTGRQVALRLTLASLVAWGLLYIAPGPITIVLAGFVALSILWALLPLGDAMLILSEGPPSFGVGRAIGSITFVGGVFLGGWLKDAAGAGSIVPAILLLNVLTMVSAAGAPKAPLGNLSGGLSFAGRLKKAAGLYRRPTLLFMLLSTGPLQATHAFYYGFSATIWQAQGFSGKTTSALWATGVAVEILMLMTASFWARHLTPQRLILIGAIGSIIRWTGLSTAPDLPVAFALQLLHGLSFAAVYLGAVQVIDRDVARDDKTVAFSLQAALTSGTFTGVAGIASGALYDSFHVHGYLAMTALACVGLLFTLLLMWRIAVRPERN